MEMNAGQAVGEGRAGWLPFRAVVDPDKWPPGLHQTPEEQIRELMAGEAVSERQLTQLIQELRVSPASGPGGQELLSELLVHEGSSGNTKRVALAACLPLLDDGLLDWWSLEYRFKDDRYQTDKGIYGLDGIKRLVTLYGRMILVISDGCVVGVSKDLRSFLGKLLEIYKEQRESYLRRAYEHKEIEEWPFPAITVMRAVVGLREYSALEGTIPFYPGEGELYKSSGVLCAIPFLWWVVTEGLKKSPNESIKRGPNLHAMSIFQRMYANTSQAEKPGSTWLELLARGERDAKAVYDQLVEWFHKPWTKADGSPR